MIALVDCNSFYASCEQAFDWHLAAKPVVVLSNNDGCVISRSHEAKAMGIQMGEPYFKIKALAERHGVAVYSSNYALYGDMSNRIMTLLSQFTPELEVYSIDEAFLDLRKMPYIDLAEYAFYIRSYVLRCTGVPTGIGIAKTKTLAKVANKLAKKRNGICLLKSVEEIEQELAHFAIADLWGIGSRYAAKLEKNGIRTALDLYQANPDWVKREFTVQGLRLWHELHSTPCIPVSSFTTRKENICTSRSFGRPQTEYRLIEEAVATFAARCGQKLRKQKSCAQVVIVFLQTNYFNKEQPQYSQSTTLQLPVATNNTFTLVHYAILGLKRIFLSGYHYKKAGVIVCEICADDAVMGTLFETPDILKANRQEPLLHILDNMNKKYGTDTLRVARQGYNKEWRTRAEQRSPRYTTCYQEILEL